MVFRLFLVFMISLFYAVSVAAFDTKTHVWIGQQIINDLENDVNHNISLPPFGEFSVDPQIANSILNNKSTYRMGNVGPDAFPDIAGGQFTVHSGTRNGWKTDQWLEFIQEGASTEKEIAFFYGMIGHAAADVFAHTYVNMYAGDVFDFFDGELDTEARHVVLEKYIANHLPSLKDFNGTYIGEPYQVVSVGGDLPLNYIGAKFIRNSSVMNEYEKANMLHLAAMYKIEKEVSQITDELDTLLNISSPTYVATELVKLQLELTDLLFLTPATILVEHTRRRCSGWGWTLFGSTCLAWETVRYFVEEINDEYTRIRRELDDVIEQIEKVRLWGVDVASTMKAWSTNIKIASEEYIRANSKEAKNVLKTGMLGGALLEWLDCYSSGYAGVPVVFSELGCQVNYTWRNGYDPKQAVLQTLDGLTTQYSDIAIILANPIYYIDRTLRARMDALVLEIVQLITSEIIDLAGYDKVFDHGSIILKSNVGDSDLLTVFQYDGLSVSGGSKHLLKINDVVGRVKADMHLDQFGKFDPDEFSVIHNAVVLSKLALLGADELNRLVSMAGVSTYKVYTGNQLFNGDNSFNILFGAIGNIDGGFSWMGIAPMYPRESGFDDTSTKGDRQFGYSSIDGLSGFRLWVEPEVREKVFRKIFKGPVAPSIEFPSDVAQQEILPSYYKERVCAGNPFPIGTSLQRCGPTAAWLMPILQLVLQ